MNVAVKEAGYIFVYLSYESQSNNYVYFDDFKVTITPTNVVQYNEYYPFGLQTADSWTRDNNSNAFLYDAGNELNSTTQWYEMYYRGYDPALGRMLQVDPYARLYASHTPYKYALNSPVNMNDPTGGYEDSGGAHHGGHLFWYSDPDYGSNPWARGGRFFNLTLSLNGYANVDLGSGFGGGAGSGGPNLMNASRAVQDLLSSPFGGSWSNGQTHHYTAEEAAIADYSLTWNRVRKDRVEVSENKTVGEGPYSVKYTTYWVPQLQNNGGGWLAGTASAALAFMSADISVPDPTDAALAKWIGYGATAIIAGGILYFEGVNPQVTNTTTSRGVAWTEPPRKPTPGGDNPPEWVKNTLITLMGLGVLNSLGKINPELSPKNWNGSGVNGLFSQTGSYFNNIWNTTVQGVNDVHSGLKKGWPGY